MANYFYKWAPLLVIGTLVLLGLPWLGLIALILVLGVLVSALATLALAIASALAAISRTLRHHVAPAFSPSTRRRSPHLVPTSGEGDA